MVVSTGQLRNREILEGLGRHRHQSVLLVAATEPAILGVAPNVARPVHLRHVLKPNAQLVVVLTRCRTAAREIFLVLAASTELNKRWRERRPPSLSSSPWERAPLCAVKMGTSTPDRCDDMTGALHATLPHNANPFAHDRSQSPACSECAAGAMKFIFGAAEHH